jgi:hypothetical protein
MKRWMRYAAWLYPASWRRRYAGEFEALLEDAELRWNDFWDILRGALLMQMKMWTFGKVACGFGLVGLAIAAVIAMRAPSEYMSTAVLRVSSSQPGATPAGELNRLQQIVLSRYSLSKLMIDGKLYETERASKPLEDIVQGMRSRDIQIRPLSDPAQLPANFSVSFRYGDAAKAQRGAQALAARFLENGPGQSAALELLDPALLPQRPFAPNRALWISAGLIAGLVVGALVFGAGRWPKVALTGVAGGLVALGGTYFLSDTYRSMAVLRAPDDRDLQLVSQSIGDRAFLRSVIQGPLQLFPGKPIEEAVDEMRNHHLRIQNLQRPGGQQAHAIAISFDYSDDSHEFALMRKDTARYQVQAVVQELARHAMTTANAEPGKPGLEVLDPANLPEQAFSPNRPFIVGIGLLAGVVFGIALQLRGRFRTPALTQA